MSQNKYNMTHDRAMELLNSVIDHVAVAENTSTQISELLAMGFTGDELVNCFNYSQEDVDNVENNDDNNSDDEDDPCPFGGDITNDCADCAYGGDYHYIDGECISREDD